MWYFESGHLLDSDNVKIFADFCGKSADAFGDLVDWWATLNEPQGQGMTMFLTGDSPNNGKGIGNYISYTKNAMDAHVECYKSIKQSKYGPSSKVGTVQNIMQFESTSK